MIRSVARYVQLQSFKTPEKIRFILVSIFRAVVSAKLQDDQLAGCWSKSDEIDVVFVTLRLTKNALVWCA
jgi:hypothetical protein